MDTIGFDQSLPPEGGDNAQNPKINADQLKQLMGQMGAMDAVEQILRNDSRITNLAEYEVTRGYTHINGVTKEEIQARFADFKGIVKRGEFTLQGLENDVYARWGITEPARATVAPVDPEAPEAPAGPATELEAAPEQKVIGFTPKKDT
jgi:hypothetical protein